TEVNKQGTTVLLIEQNAVQALQRADRGYVLETGTVAQSGRAADLLADESLRAAYLGVAKPDLPG
ncbi:MAG: ABC transporter ATP-binding protein, partial [Acidimicrobiales bacterium]